jgi:hypothetical protein
MLVVKICMWPGGDRRREKVLSVGALDCVGIAQKADPDQGVVAGERAYKVRLFKDTAFGGPDGAAGLEHAPVWREGRIRGHIPGSRGTWDLVGGALRELLGERLRPYKTGGP